MSRQCSREEKDGSFRSRSGNQSGSFRRAPDSASISYKSSFRTPSPSMRKSQSDYHYVRGRDSSLHDSMLKANTVKRSSQRSHTDSLDIPPGVCKSASAQNLTIDTNLLHPDHNKLHKSWSLTSNNTHSTENLAKMNRSSTVLNRSRHSISIGEQTRSALLSESFDKEEVCPWDVEQEQSGDKILKHVTYANSQDSEEQSPSSPTVLVCPWDHLPPVENNPIEEKGIQVQTADPKQPVHVSASAPGSPRPIVTKDQRVFSFRSTTTKWLSVKSIMGSMDAASRSSKEGNLNRDDSISQKSHESASPTPRSGTSSRRPSMERRTLQKRSMTTDGKPCLVKQNAIRMSSGDSSDRSPRRFVMVKPPVYPVDVDDFQKEGTYENVFLSRQSSKRSSTSSWETISSSRTPSTHRRGSNRITPVRTISHADICPWEGPGTLQQGEGPRKQQSIKADVCPWEQPAPERPNICPWESHQQGTMKRQESERSDVCPWEAQDTPSISEYPVLKDSKIQPSLKHSTDVCPWETSTPIPTIRQDSGYGNVCPWDVKDPAEAVYENLNTLETKGSLKVPKPQEAIKLAAYPGTSREISINEQHYQAKSAALHMDRQQTMTAQSCPWDFPDPPEGFEDTCPEEAGKTESANTNSPSQITIVADICPWETGHQDKLEDSQKCVLPWVTASAQVEGSDAKVNVCPWDTQPSENIVAPKMVSQGVEGLADVCPWETGEIEPRKTEASKTLKSNVRQGTVQANVCPWETEEAGTVETEVSKVPEKLHGQTSSQEDVCPWETEAPKVLERKDSSRANVCPWETNVAKKQGSGGDVCPWDTEEPEDGSRAGVCPWETDGTQVLQKQDSIRGDVCPWDTEEPKDLKRQDSTLTDVCPWDTEEKVVKKQDSARANVCPWETDEPEAVKTQEDTGAEVCLFESKDPQSESKVPDGDQEEVPENQGPLYVGGTPDDLTEQTDESKEGLALGRRDALCPWDMVRSRSGSFTDNNSDVFTWEPENIPEEDEEDDDAECAAEALIFPPDL